MDWFRRTKKITTSLGIANGDSIKNSTINQFGGMPMTLDDLNKISELLDRKLQPLHDELHKIENRSRKNNEALKIYINNNGVDEKIKKICNDILSEDD